MKRSVRCLALLLFLVALSVRVSAGRPGDPGRNADLLAKLSPGTELQSGVVVVKFAAAVRPALTKSSVRLDALSPVLARYGVFRTEQMFPSLRSSFAPDGREIGIDRMYRIEYASAADPRIVARELAAVPGVEYAEPERIHHVVQTPNDPMLAQQYAVDAMKLKEAWDITTGSRDVVIGVVDTGVHWTHEDLRENLWINPGEDANKDGKYTTADLNKVDDDGDGYVDNIIGIDFAGADGTGGGTYYDVDPQPTATGNNHGTHVAGIMAAVGNNGKGIAGVAFSCRYLPVKCGSDNGGTSIIRGYDGIVYAANKGAKVINCSWGGAGGYLQSEIDRIDYALSKGAVVVAAAGNDGREGMFTPSAYPNVLSVTSTGSTDRISGFSNFGTWTDVAAPGESILSSVSASNSAYSRESGTSMASPNAAGVVALVASKRPDLSGRQLAEQVRVTADNIDALQAPRYSRKVGYGRVNALRALSLSLPSVRMTDWTLSDARTGNGNGIVERGETIEIAMTWKNFLSPTKNASVTLSTTNPRVTITNGTFALGVLGTNAEAGNSADPFIISVADVEALNDQIDIFFSISDDGYDDYGGISFFQQPTYRDHTVNDVLTTVTNDGNVGFDDFSGLRGSGFVYKNNGFNVLFEGALMIGAKVDGVPIVVDVVRDESGSNQLSDFIGTTPVLMKTPGTIAAQEGFAEFTDANARDTQLGVKVDLHSYAFTEDSVRGAIIVEYTITNTSTKTLEDLHAGLFFDWDIGTNATSDFSTFDTTSLTAYAYETGAGKVPTIVGATVLTRGAPTHFVSINNPDADSRPPVFGIHNGFTKDEKWRSLSSGIWHTTSSITDIAQVIANGPYTLAPGGKAVVAFALTAGLKSADVLKTTPKVLDLWRRITSPSTAVDGITAPAGFGISSVYPNPARANSAFSIGFDVASTGMVRVDVVDALGRVVSTVADRSLDPGTYHAAIGGIPAGVYFVRMTAANRFTARRFVVQ